MNLREFFGDRIARRVVIVSLAIALVALALPPIGGVELLYKWAKFELDEEEARGTPPYRTSWEVQLTESERDKHDKEIDFWTKVALVEFPDAKSCLEDSVEAVMPEALTRMDWGKFGRTAQVEVCTFRVLAAYGDISHATDWFEDQGLRVFDGFSSANPYVEVDGTLRVYGRWSIRDSGPKFHQSGILHMLNPYTPYAMNIDSYWSPDGQSLLYVNVSYLYK